jgi:hypothetical protein
MVLGQTHLVLEIMFGDCDIPLVGVVSFLIATIIAGRNGDALGVPLLLLLVTLGAFPNALGGGLRWCLPATTGACFHVAQDKSGPDRLLARGMLSGSVV